MAEAVELEFRGSGTLFEQLEQLEGNVARLGDVHKTTHENIQQDLKKSGDETRKFSKDIAGTSQLVVALSKSAGQGLPALAKNLEAVADLTEQVQGSLSATDKTNLTSVNAALRDMAAKAGLVVKEIGKEKQARLDNLVATQKITAAEAQLLKEVTEVVDTLREGSTIPPPNLDDPIQKAQTLQQQYREAFKEAQRLSGTPGPEFDRATAEAARLKEELSDVRERINALNPDDKIGAFTKLGNALAGGAQAAGGFFLVFADGNQKLQETIFKFQSFLFALQGAQTFFADIKDAYQNVLAVLGLTTKATVQSAAASEADAVAKGEQAAATAAVGTASTGAATGIRTMTAALLGNPIFLFAAGLALAVGLLVALTAGTEEAKKSYQELLDLANQGSQRKDLELQVKQAQLTKQLAEEQLQRERDVQAGRRANAERTRAEIERDAARQAALDGTLAKQQKDTQKSTFEELQALKRQAVETDDQQRAKSVIDEQKFTALRKALALDETATKEEVVKAYYDRKKEFRDADSKAEDALQGTTLGNLSLAMEERKKLFEDLQDLKREAIDADKTGRVGEILDEKKFSELKKALDLDENATKQEVAKAYYDKKAEFRAADLQATTEAIQKESESISAQSVLIAEQAEKEKAAAELRKRIREELAEALEQIEKTLKEKVEALEIEQSDPNTQLERRRQAAQAEINLLERDMKRAAALIELREKLSAEALDRMTEKEREAAADRQIAAGGGKIGDTQAAQLQAFRLLTEQKYLRESIELNEDHARTLLEIEAQTAETRRKELELDLAARARELKDAGATDAQITEDAIKKRKALEQSIAGDALRLEEQTQLDVIAAKLAGAKGNAEAERAAQMEVLAVKIEFAEKALALIDDTGTAEAKAQVAAAQKVIAELKGELKTLQDQVVPVSIFDLLGIKLDTNQQQVVKDAFRDIGKALNDIIQSNMEARQRDLEDQIANTDAIVDDQRRRRDELNAELEKEQEKANAGRANNVLNIKKAIAEVDRTEKAALADKKRLQQEQQKIARQQVLIDSAAQASGLASGVANLIKTWSTLPFGVGLVAAFAQAALIYSFFSGIKNKLAAASQPQQLRVGTKSVQRAAGEPSGIDTVAAMLTEDEAVVPVAQNRKHRSIVGAVIDDDFSKLTPKELEPILNQINIDSLLEGTGITVNEKETRETISLHTTIQERERLMSLAGVENRLDSLNDQVRKMRESQKEKNRETTERLADGTVIRRGPFGTEIIR